MHFLDGTKYGYHVVFEHDDSVGDESFYDLQILVNFRSSILAISTSKCLGRD